VNDQKVMAKLMQKVRAKMGGEIKNKAEAKKMMKQIKEDFKNLADEEEVS
jgi:uncharacterized lipoprotein YehR (DUF1307 family)